MSRVTVIGCGAWATTIAKMLGENRHEVQLWCHREAYQEAILTRRENSLSLPGVRLPDTIHPTLELGEALSNTDAIVLGVPSVHLNGVFPTLFAKAQAPVLSIVKGVLAETPWQISQFVNQNYSGPFLVLSGPNLAKEISHQKPAATVIASKNLPDAIFFQHLLHRPYFRVYTSTDVLGVELGGVLKNIFAISAGICDGLELGQNAKSALITRGLREMIQFGEACGASPASFYGLSGLGDLMATCHSTESRNWKMGFALAKGQDQHFGSAIPEGVRTSLHLAQLALDLHLDLPITSLIARLIRGEMNAQDAIQHLMDRELKTE